MIESLFYVKFDVFLGFILYSILLNFESFLLILGNFCLEYSIKLKNLVC